MVNFSEILQAIVIGILSYGFINFISSSNQATSATELKSGEKSDMPAKQAKKKKKSKAKPKAKKSQQPSRPIESTTESEKEAKESPIDVRAFIVDDGKDSSSEDERSARKQIENVYFKPKQPVTFQSNKKLPKSYPEGTKVLSRFEKGPDYYPGMVKKAKKGLHTVVYDDGEVEYKVPYEYIKRQDGDEDDEDEEDEVASKTEDCPISDDGWEVVSTVKKPKDPSAPRIDPETGEIMLTKKQRESRRRREKLKEQKIQMRQEAQEKSMHGRWQRRN